MDKYSGCNKVESISYIPQKPKAQKTKRSYRSFFVRLAVAGFLVACICAVVYMPVLAPYREAVKSVLCYDMFGHAEIGYLPILSRLN